MVSNHDVRDVDGLTNASPLPTVAFVGRCHSASRLVALCVAVELVLVIATMATVWGPRDAGAITPTARVNTSSNTAIASVGYSKASCQFGYYSNLNAAQYFDMYGTHTIVWPEPPAQTQNQIWWLT